MLKVLGSNQTEVTNKSVRILYSYNTPVAVEVVGGPIYQTEEKYSKTTTKHINSWLAGRKAIKVSQSQIDTIAS